MNSDNSECTDSLSGVINLESYPIEDTDHPDYTSLVARLSTELHERQYCVLSSFIPQTSINDAVEEVQAVVRSGFRNASRRNCYLRRTGDPTSSRTHPDNIFFDASYTMIAADLLSTSSILKRFYYSQKMIDFVARVTRSDALFPSADPYQPVNVLCSNEGDRSAWHFDSWNAFTMTLMLQCPDDGGHFELVPNIRSRDKPNSDEVSKVLMGDLSRVVRVPREPGALVIFRGSTSLHRVTPVEGDRPRFMAVFVYENSPGVCGDPQVNATVYGPRCQNT